MKKNLIAAAVAGVLAVPFAVQAGSHGGGPKVDVGADAQMFYLYNDNTTADTTTDEWQSRVRVKFTATDGKNAMAAARIRMRDYHGDKAKDGGPGKSTNDSFYVDYAYLQLNVDDMFKLKAGDWDRNWGHKLYLYDKGAHGASILKDIGPIKLGLHYVMIEEDTGSVDADASDE